MSSELKISNRSKKLLTNYKDKYIVLCDICGNYSTDQTRCSRCLKLFERNNICLKGNAKKVAVVAPQLRNSCNEIEILSSDEDGENGNDTIATESSNINSKEILSEYHRTNTSKSHLDNLTTSSNNSEVDKFSKPITSMAPHLDIPCLVTQVGSYMRKFKSTVLMSLKELKFCIPPCDVSEIVPQSKLAIVTLYFHDVIKFLINFDTNKPLLIVIATSKFCNQTRMSLRMTGSAFNFCSASRVESYKRLMFFIDPIVINDNFITKFKKFVPKYKLEEISNDEVSRIFTKLSKASNELQKRRISSKSSIPRVAKLLDYQTLDGKISITTMDYNCLATEQFINDTIIDFYIDHILRTHLDSEGIDRIHVFSTFFYQRLIDKKSDYLHRPEIENVSADERRHLRVKKWTKNTNIFDKDFIIVPINDSAHWYLVIICFPYLDGCVTMDTNEPYDLSQDKEIIEKLKMKENNDTKESTTTVKLDKSIVNIFDPDIDRDEADPSNDTDVDDENRAEDENLFETELKPIKQPCILIFDSLSIPGTKNRVIATLREYLKCEYYSKFKEHKTFTKDSMPGYSVKVPQQTNYTDCGLYVLQYIESFITHPIKDYRKPIKGLMKWFEEIQVTAKREYIANLIRNKMTEKCPINLPFIPDILFPTRNGELITDENESNTSNGNNSSVVNESLSESKIETSEQTTVFDEKLKIKVDDETVPEPEHLEVPESDPQTLLETAVKSITEEQPSDEMDVDTN